MLWFIIAIIVVVIFVAYMIIEERWCLSWGEIFGFGFIAFIVAMLCAFLLTTLSGAIADECAAKTYSVAEDVDIYALQDNITNGGSFFLGSGHVDNELKYFYVTETELGYTINSIDADDVYIKYTTDRCHVEKHTYTFDNWFVRCIAIPMTERYVFYIPEGSVINNYAVDLK